MDWAPRSRAAYAHVLNCGPSGIVRTRHPVAAEPPATLQSHPTLRRSTELAFDEQDTVIGVMASGNAIRPSFQKDMYTATPCKKVYSIDTGHSPFLSAPAELAGILADV